MDYLLCMYVLECESGPTGSRPSGVISSLYGAELGWTGFDVKQQQDGWMGGGFLHSYGSISSRNSSSALLLSDLAFLNLT